MKNLNISTTQYIGQLHGNTSMDQMHCQIVVWQYMNALAFMHKLFIVLESDRFCSSIIMYHMHVFFHFCLFVVDCNLFPLVLKFGRWNFEYRFGYINS